jgi:hypothetical protein
LPPLSRAELLRLARAGAGVRVSELRQEIDSIYRSFPELRRGRPPRATRASAADTSVAEASAPRAKRRSRKAAGRPRRGWTAAQRKAVSERMRKYWAGRRAGQVKKK